MVSRWRQNEQRNQSCWESVAEAFGALGLKYFEVFDIRMDKNGIPWVLEIKLFCSFGIESLLNIVARKLWSERSEIPDQKIFGNYG